MSLLFFVSPGLYSANDCSIETISQVMLKPNASASFNQEKQIKGLTRSLKSNGVLWLGPEEQLVWQTQFPIKSTLVLSSDDVRQFDKNDQSLSTPSNAMIGNISQVFLNLIKGDFSSLENSFSSEHSCDAGYWKIKLVPHQQPLSNLFNVLIIEGEDYLSKVVIQEKRGDLTTINLIDLGYQKASDFEKYLVE